MTHVHHPGQPFEQGPFQPGPWQPEPFQPGELHWPGDDVGVPPPARPQPFRVQGPQGYQGLGWRSQFGPSRVYTHYQDQSGRSFSLWQIGNLFQFR